MVSSKRGWQNGVLKERLAEWCPQREAGRWYPQREAGRMVSSKRGWQNGVLKERLAEWCPQREAGRMVSSKGGWQNGVLKERLEEAVHDTSLEPELHRLNIELPRLDYPYETLNISVDHEYAKCSKPHPITDSTINVHSVVQDGSFLQRGIGQCPVAQVLLGIIEVPCLLDTGAQVSIITESFLHDHLQGRQELLEIKDNSNHWVQCDLSWLS